LPGSARLRWLDDLGRDDKLLLYNEEASVVFGAAVVCTGGDRYQLSLSKVVDAVHAVLMGTDDHAQLVHLEELLDLIGPVAHDVILLQWVTLDVWMHAYHVLRSSGVRPEEVHRHLLHLISDASEVDLEWSVDLFDVFELDNSRPEACVDTEDLVVR